MARSKVPADPRGGHVRLYWEVADSVAWRALSYADRSLWLAMRRKLLGSNNGNIEATLATLKDAGVTSSASLSKSLRALLTVGLIAKTRQGGITYGSRLCSLYRFTDEAMHDWPKLSIKSMPATNDWRTFATLAQVRTALRTAHAAAKRPTGDGAPKLQKVKRSASGTEPKASQTDSIPEQEAAALVHKLKQAAKAKTGRETA